MSNFKITGKILSITEEEFVSSKNIPYIKVILTLQYEADIFSWKQQKWFIFPKVIMFEHLLTRFYKDKDALYEEFYMFRAENSHDNVFAEVEFWIESEKREITTASGYQMTIIDHKFRINHIKSVGEPYSDIKDTDQTFLDNQEVDYDISDLPF